MQVVLEADQLGRLVGLQERVEGHVDGDARRALGAGEQLEHDEAVGVGLLAACECGRLERRNLREVLGVKLAFELRQAGFGVFRQVGLAGVLGGRREQSDDDDPAFERGVGRDGLVGLLAEFQGRLGVVLAHRQRPQRLIRTSLTQVGP